MYYSSFQKKNALDTLRRAAPGLVSFLGHFYGRSSRYLYRTGRDSYDIITATEGIEQGDAAGPALFAAGLRDPLVRLRTELASLLRARGFGSQASPPSDDEAYVFSYLDDTLLGVPAAVAEQALDLAERIFTEEGYTLNRGKSGCWSPQTPPDSLPASWQLPPTPESEPLWKGNGLFVAGIPVYNKAAPDCPLVIEKLTKVLQKAQRENSSLLEICASAATGWSRVQASFHVLRLSLATKFIFYAQTIDPSLAEPFAREFDKIILDSFTILLDCLPGEFHENAVRQMQLQLKHGGLGFHSHSQFDLQKFYVASAALAAPPVAAATGLLVGSSLVEEQAVVHPSEHILANSVHLLAGAGIPAPDFAEGGPREADVFLSAAATCFGEFHRSTLMARFGAANDTESQARLLSCGGIGAQWLATLPTNPRLCFEDRDFVAVLRFRLGLDTFSEGRCPHVNRDGVQCTQQCDSLGRHLFKCQTGGGWIMAHDSVLLDYGYLVDGPDGIPGAEADWKPHVEAWPRTTRDAEADVGFYRLPGMRDTYVDGVISYSDPATYPGCESTPGHVAELKKRDKHREHPVFDARLRRRVPFDFVALSFERHGRWANETVSFTKKLACCRALAAGLEPADEICRWYAVISCSIQRTNAKILRGEPVPAVTAPPSWRRLGNSGPRDLGVAGR